MFFTVTPCDECSFRVRLYATCDKHTIPSIDDIQSQQKCLLDLTARKKWRAKYPGACELEYENVIQIVINILIGWEQSSQIGKNGIFGVPLTYAEIYITFSHISLD